MCITKLYQYSIFKDHNYLQYGYFTTPLMHTYRTATALFIQVLIPTFPIIPLIPSVALPLFSIYKQSIIRKLLITQYNVVIGAYKDIFTFCFHEDIFYIITSVSYYIAIYYLHQHPVMEASQEGHLFTTTLQCLKPFIY